MGRLQTLAKRSMPLLVCGFLAKSLLTTGLFLHYWRDVQAGPKRAYWQCRIERVIDGDTVRALCPHKQRSVRVRLAKIDAPERSQRYGVQATEHLKQLIDGQKVTIYYLGHDYFGRVLGVIYYQGRDVNAEMVADGYAWVYDKYAGQDAKLQQQQKRAQARHLGLWSAGGQKPVPPWEYRHRQTPKTAAVQ